MNKQTVYSILMDKFHRMEDVKQAQDLSLKELVGQIVLTPSVRDLVRRARTTFLSFRYNNETYRILDIAWDKDPSLPFTKRDGSQQTLTQYYREVREASHRPDISRTDFVLLRNIKSRSKTNNNHCSLSKATNGWSSVVQRRKNKRWFS